MGTLNKSNVLTTNESTNRTLKNAEKITLKKCVTRFSHTENN
jgi:hypothetical protein